MSSRKCRRTGFTLIELLVVVSIIALLLSILLPSLNRAKNQAKIVRCASNLRQLGIALYAYASSNSGKLPPHEDIGYLSFDNGYVLSNAAAGVLTMRGHLTGVTKETADFFNWPDSSIRKSAYLDDWHYFECPAAKVGQTGGVGTWDEQFYRGYLDYCNWGAFPGEIVPDTFGQRGLDRKTAFTVYDKGGARTLLMFDYYRRPDLCNHMNVDRRRNGGNVLFLDGHVGWQWSKDWTSCRIKGSNKGGASTQNYDWAMPKEGE